MTIIAKVLVVFWYGTNVYNSSFGGKQLVSKMLSLDA